MDEEADLIDQNKLQRVKTQRNAEILYNQIEFLQYELHNLEELSQTISQNFTQSNLSTLKTLKQDIHGILEAFISIFIGKSHWNNPNLPKNVSSFEIAKSLLNLNSNGSTNPPLSSTFIHSQFGFLDDKLLDLSKLSELWRNKSMIVQRLATEKQFQRYSAILSNILEYSMNIYESALKKQLLNGLERQSALSQQRLKNLHIGFAQYSTRYQYYKELYQQLQNYIKAIMQQDSQVINSFFTMSLTKLIQEILRKEDQGEDDARDTNKPKMNNNITNGKQLKTQTKEGIAFPRSTSIEQGTITTNCSLESDQTTQYQIQDKSKLLGNRPTTQPRRQYFEKKNENKNTTSSSHLIESASMSCKQLGSNHKRDDLRRYTEEPWSENQKITCQIQQKKILDCLKMRRKYLPEDKTKGQRYQNQEEEGNSTRRDSLIGEEKDNIDSEEVSILRDSEVVLALSTGFEDSKLFSNAEPCQKRLLSKQLSKTIMNNRSFQRRRSISQRLIDEPSNVPSLNTSHIQVEEEILISSNKIMPRKYIIKDEPYKEKCK